MNGTPNDNSDKDKQDIDDDVESAVDPEHTIVMDTDVEDVSETTGEINVEELVAKLDKADDTRAEEKRAIKARLDELSDRKMTEEELGSTYTLDIDDDS